MKEYINCEKMHSELSEMLKETRDGFELSEAEQYVIDDDFCEDYAAALTERINDDMRRYLHLGDHAITGIFANVDHDYKGNVCEMVAHLDDGLDDEQTEADRDFLTDWFWEAFGCWAIKYKFGETVSEMCYQLEKENAESVA